MPKPYTPTARIAAADPAMPDGDASNAAPFRDLLDARAHLRQIAWGSLVWGGRIATSGSAAHPVLSCDQIDVVALCDSAGVWWPAYTGAVTIPEAAMTLPLSSSTHYNVYAKTSTSGVLGFEVTTAGRDSAVYRTSGSEQRRFLGTFTTDASGNPFPGWVSERGATFRTGVYNNGIRALAGGTATSIAQVNLAAFIPPRATVVHLVAELTAGGGGDVTLNMRAHGDTFEHLFASATAGKTTASAVRMPVLAQSIDYVLDASGALTLQVTGWEE